MLFYIFEERAECTFEEKTYRKARRVRRQAEYVKRCFHINIVGGRLAFFYFFHYGVEKLVLVFILWIYSCAEYAFVNGLRAFGPVNDGHAADVYAVLTVGKEAVKRSAVREGRVFAYG